MGHVSALEQSRISASNVSTTEGFPMTGELSRDEIVSLAEAYSQRLLGVTADEAFAMLDRRDLEGTMAEGSLGSLHWLLSLAR